MDHSITGLIDCPSAHLPTRADRPTSRPTSVTREARACSGPLVRRPLRGGERQPSEGGQLRSHSGMSTTSPARLVALLTPSAHARAQFVGAARYVATGSGTNITRGIFSGHKYLIFQNRAGRAGRAPLWASDPPNHGNSVIGAGWRFRLNRAQTHTPPAG